MKGQTAITLAAELKVSPQTILNLRRAAHESACALQPKTPLTDEHTETDEMFQNAGKKARNTVIRWIRRAAARTISVGAAPMPMIVRQLWARLDASGQVRLRVVPNTTGETLEAHVHQFTHADAIVYSAEANGYNHIIRRLSMGFMNMRAMTMATESAKCIAIPLKECGRMSATFCAPSKACTRNTWLAT